MGTCPDGQTTYGCYCDLQGHLTCQIECPAPARDGGVTCLLEGYDYGPNAPGAVTCNAGSFCAMGTCPNSNTQFGCVCNADGTATCDLECPPPASCVIPGEGTCPSGSQCTYGICDGSSSAILACPCFDGTASCYMSSCPEGDSGSDGG